VNHYRVWAEIDLDAVTHNLMVIRRYAGAGVRLMPVIKADAYGHGAVAIAHHAVRCGIAGLGVGTSAEALELREAGLRVPILVLGTIVDEEAVAALKHGVEIGIHSSDRVHMLAELATRMGIVCRVHLNIDTGMGRLGVLPQCAIRLLEEIHASPHLQLGGVMTHISSRRGSLDPRTAEQVRVFERVLAEARERRLLRGWIHVANSAALFTGLERIYDTVRPGISIYGVLPSSLPGADELLPAMSLVSQIVFLKDVPVGTSIGYDSTWTTDRPTRIATLSVGYNDGVSFRLGNRGEVLVRGRRAPIVGRVSMDYTTIDVGHIPGVEVGDAVTLFGRAGAEAISVSETAAVASTIPYEITCSVGKRVTRVYVGGEEVPLPSQEAPASGHGSPTASGMKSKSERATTS
jgi:alanine racemase